ncbi:hypothetical protein ACHAXM_005164 [Skeletonema potamos]
MIMNNIFHLTFALAAAALMSSPVAVTGLHLEPRLRGAVLVAVSDEDDYDNGYQMGQQQATYFWTNKFNSDCNRISSYDTMIGNYIRDNYNYNNYGQQQSNQWYKLKGATEGMQAQQKVYDNQCMSNDDYVDVKDCSAIGHNIASSIAHEYAKNNPSQCGSHFFSLPPPPAYGKFGNNEECITIANDDCIGNMDDKINTYCSSQYTNYNVLSRLKTECYSQVQSAIGQPAIGGMN